jgi:hypothetical protein
VLVAGGRGFMGRRIVRLLKESLPDVEVLTGGRSAANDRRLDVHAPEDDYASLRDVDVLINTVGPFDYDPSPIVSACIDTQTHNVDIAETDDWVEAVRLRGAGERAVITGCSTVPGLIDVFAQHWPGQRVRAQLSIGTNNESSAALLYSMLRPVGRSNPRGGRWFNHTWLREHEGLRPRRYGPYPGCGYEFGFGFDRRSYTTALWLLAPLVAATPDWLLKAGAVIGNALAPLARSFGTKVGILAIDALDDAGEVTGSIEVRAQKDGLDVPSWPSVWATELLLADPRPATRLSDLLTPQDATQRLRDAGYEVRGLD